MKVESRSLDYKAVIASSTCFLDQYSHFLRLANDDGAVPPEIASFLNTGQFFEASHQ